MRCVLALISAAAVAAAVGHFVSAAGAVSVVRSATVATFSDAVGERAGAPDISTVTVSLDGEVLTVDAQVDGMPELVSDGSVVFLLNTDSNLASGKYAGADYALFWDMKTMQGSVLRWNGTDYVAAEKVADPSRMIIGGSTAGFMFNLANFGSPKHIEFSVMVSKGSPETGLLDAAPDAGLWAFEAVAPTPTPTPGPATPAPAVKPVIAAPLTTPAKAVAGKRFTVKFPVTRSDNGRPLTAGTMICDPSVNGRVLTHAESFGAGTAKLSFLVPKSMKGKQLKVKMTIKTTGGSASRVATFRIR